MNECYFIIIIHRAVHPHVIFEYVRCMLTDIVHEICWQLIHFVASRLPSFGNFYSNIYYNSMCISSFHVLGAGTLTLSQFTLAGPVYTEMPLECHWLTQCTRDTTGRSSEYTWIPLGKLNWNWPTLECYWRNSDYCTLHLNTTGGIINSPHTPRYI